MLSYFVLDRVAVLCALSIVFVCCARRRGSVFWRLWVVVGVIPIVGLLAYAALFILGVLAWVILA